MLEVGAHCWHSSTTPQHSTAITTPRKRSDLASSQQGLARGFIALAVCSWVPIVLHNGCALLCDIAQRGMINVTFATSNATGRMERRVFERFTVWETSMRVCCLAVWAEFFARLFGNKTSVLGGRVVVPSSFLTRPGVRLLTTPILHRWR